MRADEMGVTEPDPLLCGDMEIEGRMPWSSNATFLVTLRLSDETTRAIYKPHKGERPLWDFPSGLYQREVAAYELASFLGWDVIPRTVLRDGDYGIGSVQQFVDADFEQHYFTLLEGREQTHAQLRMLAALDVLANNADRKGGHVLFDPSDETIWGIDNGLCFHEDEKLRTVMWDFAGERIPEALSVDIARLASACRGSLGPLDELLSEEEIDVLVRRAQRLAQRGVYPSPRSDYAYPWPLV